MLSGGRASCVDAGPAGPPHPSPRDTVGDPAPFQVAGQTSGRRRVWASAVDMEEGSVRPQLGLRYRGSLVSAL